MKYRFTTHYRRLSGNLGICSSDSRPEITVAPPPAFKGPEGIWSPEDLFVSALESCFFLTLLFYLKKDQVELLEYESRAEGMLESVDGNLQFTRVDLYPRLVVNAEKDLGDLVKMAETGCLVARSVRCPVHVHPEIKALAH